MAFHGEFELDIGLAISTQLEVVFDRLDAGALNSTNLSSVDARKGVYLLYHHDSVVYVGKASNLKSRLTTHMRKIQGRQSIDLEDVQFKCVYLPDNWAPYGAEELLIDYYQEKRLAEWNGSSFGSNDPGRNRDKTDRPPDGFDAHYPINDQWPCETISAGIWNVRELLLAIKAELPFLFRFQVADKNRVHSGHPAYNDLEITVPTTGMPVRDLLSIAAAAIPGAQVTKFASHIILYIEDIHYPQGETILPLNRPG